jgi:metallophosphoesterase superfamily enzyme
MLIDDWMLTPQRVAVHRPTATAVVADLHLGYHAARCRHGDAVPLPDLEAELAPLFQALETHALKNLLIAGDLFERHFDENIWKRFEERLARACVEFVGLVPGNHDRGLEDLSCGITILPQGHKLGRWHVYHGDGSVRKEPALVGHHHPGMVIHGKKMPCYLVSPCRIVLPAYSKDAAGVAMHPDRLRDYRCLAIAGNELLEVRVG